MTFAEQLEARVRAVDSLVCVGLDPHPQDLSAPTGEAALAFARRIVSLTAPYAAAFKPNAAFFEALGEPGWRALRTLIAEIPDDIPVLLDAKRGDISSTAAAYARAAFKELGADALTVNPYLGADAVQPFLRDPARGVFLLCKTSNPGSADLQDLPVLDGGRPRPLYERVAELAQGWNTRDNVGLVVGATHPHVLAQVRAIAPDLWILAPGVGAQGGDAEATVRAGLRADGLGLLVNSSRGIARAADPAAAARALRDQLNAARAQGPRPAPSARVSLARALVHTGCVRFGSFTLKSGLTSPIYIDLRRLAGDPALLARVAASMLPLLRGLSFDRLAALPYAAMPIGTAVSMLGGWPFVYPRKEVKEYGTKVPVEGPYAEGETVVLLDDLATTGGSKVEAAERLAAAGLRSQDVVVLIDRQSGAREDLAARGLTLHAVFTMAELLEIWTFHGDIEPEQAARVRAFLGQR